MKSKIVENGCLRVFEDGSVERLKGYKTGRITPSIVKMGRNSELTRVTVSYVFNGKQMHRQVARLVLQAFVQKGPNDSEELVYLDNDPTNCKLSNLRWKTKDERMAERLASINKAFEGSQRKLKRCRTCGKYKEIQNGDRDCKVCSAKEERRKNKLQSIKNRYKHINIRSLTPIQQDILEKRLEGSTLEEIAIDHKISKERVRQKLLKMEKNVKYSSYISIEEQKINKKIENMRIQIAKLELEKAVLWKKADAVTSTKK